MALDEGSHCGH